MTLEFDGALEQQKSTKVEFDAVAFWAEYVTHVESLAPETTDVWIEGRPLPLRIFEPFNIVMSKIDAALDA